MFLFLTFHHPPPLNDTQVLPAFSSTSQAFLKHQTWKWVVTHTCLGWSQLGRDTALPSVPCPVLVPHLWNEDGLMAPLGTRHTIADIRSVVSPASVSSSADPHPQELPACMHWAAPCNEIYRSDYLLYVFKTLAIWTSFLEDSLSHN